MKSKEEKEEESRTAFEDVIERKAPSTGPVTAKAEQRASAEGLNPLVDPKGFGVIRRSLPRFVPLPGGFWRLAVGIPIPHKTRLDTTGSMGGNVDIALGELPKGWELSTSVLPGCDLQMAIAIFGDICDNWPLCDPQFEMDATKIVDQIMMLVPERKGGDRPEDPHYGLFSAAYLTSAWINWFGLKGYDFTVSDAPGRELLDKRQLLRIFGEDVFERTKENGFEINPKRLPSTAEVVRDLLNISHAFFIQIGQESDTTRFWTDMFGEERLVFAPRTKLLPEVEASIIGLTEGTLDLDGIEEFLLRPRGDKGRIDKQDAKLVARAVAGIPIGAQAKLPNFGKRPKKGDIFRNKTDVIPMTAEEIAAEVKLPGEKKGIEWL